jgi:two-component system chemotaxis sensor kinase CheA
MTPLLSHGPGKEDKMDYIENVLPLYISESRELLEEMEQLLLHIEQAEDPQESLNAIFRAAHTIKGSAGIFSLDDIVRFTHGVESLLDKMREGKITIDSELTSLLLDCADHIGLLLDHLSPKTELCADDQQNGKRLTQALEKIEKRHLQPTDDTYPVTSAARAQSTEKVERIDGPFVSNDHWHISVRFHEDTLRTGMEPLAILRYLITLGQIESITTITDHIPPAEDMDPESCYLGFEINFKSDEDKAAIEGVFEFIREESQVYILPPSSRMADYIAMIQALPEEDMKLGNILVSCGSLTPNELEQALGLQNDLKARDIDMPLGSIVLEQGLTSQPVVESALEKQTRTRETKSREQASVRVDADKLDQLINLVGEMVIAGAGSALYAKSFGDSTIIESI